MCFRGAFGGCGRRPTLVRNRKSTGLHSRVIERPVILFPVDRSPRNPGSMLKTFWHGEIGTRAHRRLVKFSLKSCRATCPFPLFINRNF